MKYIDMSAAELQAELLNIDAAYGEFKAKGLKLDMSRGKPATNQLDLSNDLLNILQPDDIKSQAGLDTRNYAPADGLSECRALFAQLFEVPAGQVIAGGNSSLKMMFDIISAGMTHGYGFGPWAAVPGGIKFLCPSPGYDRHFAVTEYFGVQNIAVTMTAEGPDMEEVRRLCENDPSVKGIWCVPKYSNPQGITYSKATVEAFVALKPAAPDFKIMWDNSYIVHDLTDTPDELYNIFDATRAAGTEDRVFSFASTSKITFAGAGVAALAASLEMIKLIKKRLVIESIGPDKINQLRHTRFLPDATAVKKQMKCQAEIIAPKFDLVLETLERELGALGILSWTTPNGGYFISVDTMPGCAKRVVELCAEAGAVLTGAGATYPYGKDPNDSNIRIAPTVPPMDELKIAAELFAVAVKKASLEKLMGC